MAVLDHRSTEDHDWERIARAAQVKIQTTQNPTGLKVRTFLDGKDVTNMIRTPWVTENVSVVAQNPFIRQVVLDLQHRLAQDPIRPRSTVDLVIDGRDIGTAVFPQAELKIYLVAQARVRAQRRLDELTCQAQIENPMESIPTLEELTKQIETRDQADLTRERSPLRKPSDAVEIDTTQLTIDQQVDRIITLVNAGRPKESIQ
ncbi:hypothetical protein IWQ62_000219 [Dispira parvispora]|uniref:(d)CMP kinase n=1 Tax=Dispira parvispora TaxID=1520584 RepID=A0A9W8B0N6_9FUNG|nr:hypothetical protein IWQ62_000219 [Dispira parvispora]